MIISKKNLTDIMRASASTSDEVCIDANDERLQILAVDAAHVMMMRLELPPSAYQIDEPIMLQVDTAKILDAIKMADKEDDVNINVIDGQIVIKAGRYVRRTPTIDIASSPRVPNLTTDVSFGIDSGLLRDAVKASSSVSDVFRLDYAGGDTVLMFGEQDGGRESMNVTIPVTEGNGHTGAGCYPMDYTKTIVQAMSGRLTISFSSDFPMLLTGPICGDGSLEFMVAPRIESD